MGLFNSNSNSTPNYDPYAPPLDRKRLLLMIGLGIGVLIAIVLLLMTFFSGSSKDEYMRFMVRQQELQTVTDASQKRIRNSTFAQVNSTATLLLTSDTVAFTAQLNKKFGEKSVPADFRKNVADTTTNTRLQQAELLNKFDITYRSVLLEKINALLPQAEKLKTDIGGKEFTDIATTAIKNLQSIRDQLQALEL